MRRPHISVTILALALAAASGTAGDAQAVKGHDSNAPVNFTADRLEVQDRSDRVVASGNVEVTQGNLTLNAARMTVAYSNTGNATPAPAPAATSPNGAGSNVEINRIDASGNVVVTRGNETARGNVGIYDLDRRLITMLGNVQLTQGGNRLTGGRLVMDLATGRSTVDGRATSAPGTTTSSSGRVSGTFTVPQRPAQPQQQ